MTSTEGPRADRTAAVVPDLVLRPAGPADAAGIAAVHRRSRAAAVPAMPPSVHEEREDRAFVEGRLRIAEVWVAEEVPSGSDEAVVVGYLDLEGAWLHSLYVDPPAARRGVGSALLDLAKGLRPEGFALWVFASNEPARRFYRRRGLLDLETTDGTGNEEGAPDVRMAWPGRDPLAFLRREIDAVDEELAAAVARRVALTVAIQQVKDVPGHAGRDLAREAQIAARMAAKAPGLRPEAWQALVRTLVDLGLDEAERTRPT